MDATESLPIPAPGVERKIGVLDHPLVEQRDILRPIGLIGAENVEQLDRVGEIALVVGLRPETTAGVMKSC